MMKAAAAQRCNLRTQNDSVPLNVNTMTTWQRPIATSLRQLRRWPLNLSLMQYDFKAASIFWM
jgi:hypothetical protein